MLGTKPKLGIVLGNHPQARIALVLEHLCVDFDLYVFANDSCSNLEFPSAKTYLFESITDMPGYMRGLEDYLKDMNVLISLETSTIGSFQAVRAASKYQIPCHILVSEPSFAQYQNYPNVRAVQNEVLQSCKGLLALLSSAAASLKLEGIEASRIQVIKPVIDQDKFSYNAKSRKRLREYLSIPEESRIVLVEASLDSANKPIHVLQALKLHIKNYPNTNVSIIFVGDGPQARELKYYCHDHGLGTSVKFLHQDTKKFASDLYSASDMQLIPASYHLDPLLDFPLKYLEAASTGLFSVYQSQNTLHEVFGECGKRLTDFDFIEIADIFDELYLVPELEISLTSRHDRAKLLRNHLDPKKSLITVSQLVAEYLQRTSETSSLNANLSTQLLEADRFAKLGDIESAAKIYETALSQDPQNAEAYRGLGNIALRSESYDEAIVFFRKALASRENDAPAILGIAFVYRRANMLEEALYWYERYIEIQGLDARITPALLQTALATHATSYALKILERVHEQHSENVSVMNALGQLYFKIGKIEEGKAMMAKAILPQSA